MYRRLHLGNSCPCVILFSRPLSPYVFCPRTGWRWRNGFRNQDIELVRGSPLHMNYIKINVTERCTPVSAFQCTVNDVMHSQFIYMHTCNTSKLSISVALLYNLPTNFGAPTCRDFLRVDSFGNLLWLCG